MVYFGYGKLGLMRLAVFYRPESEHERPIIEFKEMMRRRYPDKEIIEFNLNTRQGTAEAALYGIVNYPAVLVTSISGHVQGLWEGEPLPLIDEVAGSMLEQQGSSV